MEIMATVDRIQGELAVLLMFGDEKVKFNLPVVFLAGLTKGILSISPLRRILLPTDEAKERVMGLIEKLKGKG